VTLEETRNAFKGLLSRPGSRRDLPRPPKQSHAAPPPETTAVKVSVRQRSTTVETVGGRPRLASTHHVQHRFANDLAYAAKIAYIHAKRCGRKRVARMARMKVRSGSLRRSVAGWIRLIDAV